jgi:hypothetical protein
MNNLLREWIFYFPVVMLATTYALLKENTDWLYFLPFFMLCFILYDWAKYKSQDVLHAVSETEVKDE